jgi:NAD(P)-dependent dehydrogenase (short-subunit alcohol dehydrogenase family)
VAVSTIHPQQKSVGTQAKCYTAGQGFGKTIAEKFIAEGAKVVIADFKQELGEAAAKELNATFHLTDVTKIDNWESLLKKTVDTHGQCDIVINNAGSTYRNKPTNDVTDADFDLCINVNCRSIYYSAKVIIPYMQKRGKGGAFVNIASTAGLRPRPGLTWYNASKAAVINATKTMAVEYAKDNIRWTSVCPVVALGTGL